MTGAVCAGLATLLVVWITGLAVYYRLALKSGERTSSSDKTNASAAASEERTLQAQRAVLEIGESVKLLRARVVQLEHQSILDKEEIASLKIEISTLKPEVFGRMMEVDQQCKTLTRANENLQQQTAGHLERVDETASRLSTMLSSLQQRGTMRSA